MGQLREKSLALSLMAVLVAAAVLRLYGIGFGLPFEYHVDEVQYVRQAASMGSHGLEPTWWNNPPFFKYLLLAEYGLLFVVGRLVGMFHSVSGFGAQLTLDPTPLYLLGRGSSALFGVATVLLVYWLGKVTYNLRTGLVAAWFLAVNFMHVRQSHYAVNDVAFTFFVVLSLASSVMIVKRGELRWYLLAGGALGLGFATKYSALLAVVPLLAAHVLSGNVRRKGAVSLGVRKLLVSSASAVTAAIVASPYFVLTPGKVFHDAFEALYLPGQNGFEGWEIDPAGGYIFYTKTLLWGLGWILVVLFVLGIIMALRRRSREEVVLLSLPIATILVLGREEMYFARFLLPAVPPLLVLAARPVELLWTPAKAAVGHKRAVALVMVGVLAASAQTAVSSVRSDYLLTQTDTRTLAKRWIEENVPPGARVAEDWPFFGPPLSTPDKPEARSTRTYNVTLVDGKGLSDKPVQWYQEHGYDYVIASSFIYDIPLTDKDADRNRQSFYESLDNSFDLVRVFRPGGSGSQPTFVFDEIYGPAVSLWERERPGPILKVYRVKGS